MESLDMYQTYGEDLYHRLHLSTYPVAVKYIENVTDIPENTYQPSAVDRKMSLCQAFSHARRQGYTVAITADDNFCTPSTVMHRWVNISMQDLIESQVRQRWHKDAQVEESRIAALRNKLGDEYIDNPGRYIGFVCSPIHKAQFIPDSILVYCDGVQLTHIIHALCYENKHDPSSSFDGFAESCLKGALIPFLTQKPQVVIPGSGDRAFAGISDHEVGIGFPASLLFYLINYLFVTGKRLNLGFPLKTIVATDLNERISPGFKYLQKKIDLL